MINNKYYIETYGCQMNVYDSELVANQLKNIGYIETKNLEAADIIFLNTCSIREKAEETVHNKLNNLEYLIPTNIEKLTDIAKNIDHLQLTINLEMLSYYEILDKANLNRNQLIRYPAIHPVDFKTCKKTKWIKGKKITGDCYQSSLFGNRRHPVTLRWHHHDGDDYSANTGTPVFVTADGEVEKSQYSVTSGNYVLVNHGYGYKTYYGHLHKRSVKRGDKIERGDKVGEVGNTGRLTTAEHLHYEVQYNKKAKNPKDYFFDNSNNWAN